MASETHWRGRRVLVTGATGFIGQHLVQRLLELEATVYAGTAPTHDRGSTPSPKGQQPALLRFDIRDAGAVRRIIHEVEPSVVFHLAATGVTNPDVHPLRTLEVNAGGTINLLEALRGSAVDRVMLAGTSYVYGFSDASKRLDPFNAYSASKVAAWAYARTYWQGHNTPVVTVRPFQVYGPGQSRRTLIPSAIGAALAGDDFPMTPGEQLRDFVFVADVCDGMVTAADTPGIEGKSLDLGTGVGTTVRSVVQRIWAMTGAQARIRPGALPYRFNSTMHLVADAERTARLTDWRATTTLEQGLQLTIDRLRAGS